MTTSTPPLASWLGSTHVQTRLLAIIAVVLALGALRLSQAVVAPLVMAVFLTVVLWPIQSRLERAMPRILATILTLSVLLALTAAFGFLLGWSAQQLAERAPELQQRFTEISSAVAVWLREIGLPVPEWLQGDGAVLDQLATYAPAAARWAYHSTFALGLVLVYTGFGLYEARDFELKVRQRFDRDQREEMREIITRIAGKVRRFLLGVSISGAINAVALAAFSFIVGLDLALLWGGIAFLLNFIMGIGPVLAMVPPVMYAFLQFDGLRQPLIVLVGVGIIQLLVNNVVEPKVQGRVVSLSPMLVLFTVLLWGWLWGGFGALLAVPILVAVVIVAGHFESTRWIPALVTDAENEDSQGEDR